jgi:hypothetical protein
VELESLLYDRGEREKVREGSKSKREVSVLLDK